MSIDYENPIQDYAQAEAVKQELLRLAEQSRSLAAAVARVTAKQPEIAAAADALGDGDPQKDALLDLSTKCAIIAGNIGTQIRVAKDATDVAIAAFPSIANPPLKVG
jgi:hypothetical protein